MKKKIIIFYLDIINSKIIIRIHDITEKFEMLYFLKYNFLLFLYFFFFNNFVFNNIKLEYSFYTLMRFFDGWIKNKSVNEPYASESLREYKLMVNYRHKRS